MKRKQIPTYRHYMNLRLTKGGADVPLFETIKTSPFLRSSLINIIKATAIPKLTAITHFLAEFMRQF